MKTIAKLTPLALALVALAGCGGGGGSGGSTSTSSTSTSTGGQTGSTVDVSTCLTQAVGTRTVAGLVVPDVLQLDLGATQGFPNGRQLNDPVIDVTLAVLFLDLRSHPATRLVGLNPGPDVQPLATFPYLGAAQGGVPAVTGGSNFAFRTDAPSTYTRVDRMGFPAVATALVRSAQKTQFNDDSPGQDATGKWAPEFQATLQGLAAALDDDFRAAGLVPCARIS